MAARRVVDERGRRRGDRGPAAQPLARAEADGIEEVLPTRPRGPAHTPKLARRANALMKPTLVLLSRLGAELRQPRDVTRNRGDIVFDGVSGFSVLSQP